MGAVRRNWQQARLFGPRFLLRHLARFTGQETSLVFIRNFGPIHIRSHESDIDVVLQTIAHPQYQMPEPLASRVAARYIEIAKTGTPVIVDAGANIGASSLWFAKQFPLAEIRAFEPEVGNYRVLEKNAALCSRIHPMHAAIGSEDGFASIHVHAGSGWSARTARSEAGVPITTMANAFRTGTPFLAKIDIEGFESDLFSSSTEWLSDVSVVFIEPHDWLYPGKKTSRSFQRAMAERDFEIHLMGENIAYVRC